MTQREEILLNITLITVALSLLIFIILGPVPIDMSVPESARPSAQNPTVRPRVETPYDLQQDRFVALGEIPVFRAILTPTPTPPPPTPRPTPTPDINAALGRFRVVSIMDNTVIIEDPERAQAGDPDAMIEWNRGEVRQLQAGQGESKAVRLEAVDEVTDPGNPSATFSMEGTTEKRVFRLID
jgi:hypothetical protein